MDVADLAPVAGVMSRARRWARRPWLHFVVLGGLLAAADAMCTRTASSRAEREIVLGADDVAALRRGFERQYGAPPSAAEEEALLDHAIDEEVLYRRALAIGLDRENRVVRERLVTVVRMLAEDPAEDEDALYREALALGLDRTDVVVRRHLVQLMSLLIERASANAPITDTDLEAALARRAESERRAGRVTLTHVYFDPTRRGAALLADAESALGDLRRARADRTVAASVGDPFLLGARFERRSEAEIGRLLGASFASALADAAPGEWLGPLRSGYGLHLVRLEERTAERAPSLAAVRNQLLGRLREERRGNGLGTKLAAMRAEYVVRIEREEERPPASNAAAGGGIELAVPRAPRELGD